jgi:hypothetical protein
VMVSSHQAQIWSCFVIRQGHVGRVYAAAEA